ncbi:hypothetical protein KCU88_g44, partial [Aureobasidium melanogenum]
MSFFIASARNEEKPSHNKHQKKVQRQESNATMPRPMAPQSWKTAGVVVVSSITQMKPSGTPALRLLRVCVVGFAALGVFFLDIILCLNQSEQTLRLKGSLFATSTLRFVKYFPSSLNGCRAPDVNSRVTVSTGPVVSLSLGATTGESDEGPIAVEKVLVTVVSILTGPATGGKDDRRASDVERAGGPVNAAVVVLAVAECVALLRCCFKWVKQKQKPSAHAECTGRAIEHEANGKVERSSCLQNVQGPRRTDWLAQPTMGGWGRGSAGDCGRFVGLMRLDGNGVVAATANSNNMGCGAGSFDRDNIDDGGACGVGRWQPLQWHLGGAYCTRHFSTPNKKVELRGTKYRTWECFPCTQVLYELKSRHQMLGSRTTVSCTEKHLNLPPAPLNQSFLQVRTIKPRSKQDDIQLFFQNQAKPDLPDRGTSRTTISTPPTIQTVMKVPHNLWIVLDQQRDGIIPARTRGNTANDARQSRTKVQQFRDDGRFHRHPRLGRHFSNQTADGQENIRQVFELCILTITPLTTILTSSSGERSHSTVFRPLGHVPYATEAPCAPSPPFAESRSVRFPNGLEDCRREPSVQTGPVHGSRDVEPRSDFALSCAQRRRHETQATRRSGLLRIVVIIRQNGDLQICPGPPPRWDMCELFACSLTHLGSGVHGRPRRHWHVPADLDPQTCAQTPHTASWRQGIEEISPAQY